MAYKIIACPQCQREYRPSSRHKICAACRAQNAKVPCPKCGEPKKFGSQVCRNCYVPALHNNGNWKGGRIFHKAGYVMLKTLAQEKEKPRYVFEHVLVMEDKLGRRLDKNENVHHINGVRDDNRIENLELWTKPQPTGIRAEDAVVWAKEILNRYGD